MASPAEATAPVELPAVPGARAWWVSLLQDDAAVERMLAGLSAAEQHRAALQHGATARRRFIVRRWMLRQILGDLVGADPAGLAFAAGPEGKPMLAGPPSVARWEFNLSDAREVAVFAVADRRAVGIDVEWIEGSTPTAPVAARYFSASEQARLDQVPADERRAEFFRIWVRKEAYLKGCGAGIAEAIYTTEFGTGPAPDGLVVAGRVPWTIWDLEGLPPGYLGSVACGDVVPAAAVAGRQDTRAGGRSQPGLPPTLYHAG